MKDRNRFYAGLLLLSLLVLPCHLQARVYKWYDAEGGVHYSQAPPPKGSIQTSINADTFSTIEMRNVAPVLNTTTHRKPRRTIIRRCPRR